MTLDYALPPPRAVSRILAHPYSLVAVVVLLAMGIAAVGRNSSEWTGTYLASSRALIHGKDIYHEVRFNTYPPFSALLMVPFTYLPRRVAQGIWYTIQALSLVYLVKRSWRLANGPPLETDGGKVPAASVREHAAFLLGHACALQLALNALQHLQTDLLIAALLTAGCAAIARKNFVRGALWIGVSAALKATPLLFAPYLLWRRKWLAAALLVGVTVGANLLPNLAHPPPNGGLWLTQWCRLFLRPMARSDYVPGDWSNQLNNNQAIAGAVNRWFTTSWKQGPTRHIPKPEKPATRKAMQAAFFGSIAILILIVLWSVTAPQPQRPRPPNPALPPPDVIECGMVMLLMLLFSPNSSRAHFCILYLPAFCLARLAVQRPPWWTLRVCLGLAVLCSTLSIHLRLPFSKGWEEVLLWAGMVMLCTLFLLLGNVVARRSSVALP